MDFQTTLRKVVPIFSILMLLAVAVVAELPEDKVAEGILLDLDEDSLQIKVEDVDLHDRYHTFQITADTQLDRSDLSQGDRVVVEYQLGPDPDRIPIALNVLKDVEGSGADAEGDRR